MTIAQTLTLDGTSGKTLTLNNSLTLAGTDSTTMTFPSSSATIAGLGIAETFTGAQTFQGLNLDEVSPSQITSDQNNYNPSALANWRLNTDATRNITGIAGTATGRVIKITNVGSNSIVLNNESASSTAGNRIHTATGSDITLLADQSVQLFYDNTTARWRDSAQPSGKIANGQLTNSSITLNAGTNFGISAPGAMSLGSTYTIGATGDNLRFNDLGLNVAAPTSGGQIASTGGANNITLLLLKRNTDTSPTGNFLDLQNAAAASLFTVDITGKVTTGTWNGTAVAEGYGGTNQTTYATGDMLYASASNTLSKRTIGSSGQCLIVSGGVPTWGTCSGSATVRWDQLADPTAALSLNIPAVDTTSFTEQATTQTGFWWTSSTITSGMLAKLSLTGSSAVASASNSGSALTISSSTTGFTAATQALAEIFSSGTNSNNGVTVIGLKSDIQNQNATSGTNIGLYLNASGANTKNDAIQINAGNVESLGAIDWVAKANTASTFRITDGTAAFLSVDSRTTTDNINALTMDVPDPTIAGVSGTTYSANSHAAFTLTDSTTTTVSALNGLQVNIAAPTINQSGGAVTVTDASTLYVNAPTAGASVTITNPYAINANGNILGAKFASTKGVNWTLPSSGGTSGCLTSNTSNVLSVSACSNTSANHYTTSGDHSVTVPAGTLLVIVEAWGGGGGGGSGASFSGANTSAIRGGGGGGGGGAYNTATFTFGDLGGASVTLHAYVGAGGAVVNGTAATNTTQAGTNGNTGGNSYLCTVNSATCSGGTAYLTAYGGGGGGGGSATNGAGGGGGGGTTSAGTASTGTGGGAGGNPNGGAAGNPGANSAYGGAGGANVNTTAANDLGGTSTAYGGGGGGSSANANVASGAGGNSQKAGGGGGAGGSVNSNAANAETGGNGGAVQYSSASFVGAGGGTGGTGGGTRNNGTGGTAGTVPTTGILTVGSDFGGGGGGGGGAANSAAGAITGGNGGAGAQPGGGGAGGGAADTANTSMSATGGSSGAGGDGQVDIDVVGGSNADIAEIYSTTDSTLGAGDVVSIDSNLTAGVKKTQKAYDPDTVGIISTTPSIITGNNEDPGSRSVLVALAGRVPVKVSTENGVIKSGDYLTSSSVPGVAMKATKFGPMVGQALVGFDGDGYKEIINNQKVGITVAFIKNGFTNGLTNLADLIASPPTQPDTTGTSPPPPTESPPSDSTTLGSSTTSSNTQPKDASPPDVGKELLLYLMSQKDTLKQDSLSEIFTDRLAAGLEIISPRVVTDNLVLNSLEPADKNIQVNLADGGKFFVHFGDATTLPLVSIDQLGNALFSGALTAQSFEVGSADKPGGITLYDTETKEPYCVSILHGALVTSSGKCQSTLISNPESAVQTSSSPSSNQGSVAPPPAPPPSDVSPPPADSSSSTTTSTDSTTTTSPPPAPPPPAPPPSDVSPPPADSSSSTTTSTDSTTTTSPPPSPPADAPSPPPPAPSDLPPPPPPPPDSSQPSTDTISPPQTSTTTDTSTSPPTDASPPPTPPPSQ